MAGWRWWAARARAVARKGVFRDPTRVVAPASLQVGRRGGVPAPRERHALRGGASEAGPGGAPRAAHASRRPRGPRAGRPLPHGASAWLLAAWAGCGGRHGDLAVALGPGPVPGLHASYPSTGTCRTDTTVLRCVNEYRHRRRRSSQRGTGSEYACFKSQSVFQCTVA